jgi:hypothetical protein
VFSVGFTISQPVGLTDFFPQKLTEMYRETGKLTSNPDSSKWRGQAELGGVRQTMTLDL